MYPGVAQNQYIKAEIRKDLYTWFMPSVAEVAEEMGVSKEKISSAIAKGITKPIADYEEQAADYRAKISVPYKPETIYTGNGYSVLLTVTTAGVANRWYWTVSPKIGFPFVVKRLYLWMNATITGNAYFGLKITEDLESWSTGTPAAPSEPTGSPVYIWNHNLATDLFPGWGQFINNKWVIAEPGYICRNIGHQLCFFVYDTEATAHVLQLSVDIEEIRLTSKVAFYESPPIPVSRVPVYNFPPAPRVTTPKYKPASRSKMVEVPTVIGIEGVGSASGGGASYPTRLVSPDEAARLKAIMPKPG